MNEKYRFSINFPHDLVALILAAFSNSFLNFSTWALTTKSIVAISPPFLLSNIYVGMAWISNLLANSSALSTSILATATWNSFL